MKKSESGHKEILVRILKDIYTDPILGKSLGFKGGTAAYLCYGLPRTSVDLDFDLLLVQNKALVWDKLSEILSNYGRIIDSHQKRNTLLFVVQYLKYSWHIKIEVSLRPTIAQYFPFSYLGIPLLLIDQPGMLAGKLSAFLTRSKLASRDVYDVWYFLSNNWELDDKYLYDLTGLPAKVAYSKSVKKVAQISDRQLLQGMGELINDSKKDWVKSKLKSELQFLLKVRAD